MGKGDHSQSKEKKKPKKAPALKAVPVKAVPLARGHRRRSEFCPGGVVAGVESDQFTG